MDKWVKRENFSHLKKTKGNLELKKKLKDLLGEVNNRLYITEDMIFLELKDSSVEIIKANI